MNSHKHVAAIVLAAGQSTRLGRPKQLLPVDGLPLLSRTIDMVQRTSLNPIVLVLGAYKTEILDKVSTDRLNVVNNADYASGQASSLQAGIRALPEGIAGAIVFLGDQPLISPRLIETMVVSFDPVQHVAVQPEYGGGPGNPVLLSATIFPELLQLTGDVGARNVLKQYASKITQVDATRRPDPRDVDTDDDYQELLIEWSAVGSPDVPEFCQRCGYQVGFSFVHDRLRPVCPKCNFTYFYDPKLAVAVIVEIGGQIVMQKRAINPGRGLWTFPSGFVDRGEVVTEAAVREVKEETGLNIVDPKLLGIYSQSGQTVVLAVYLANADGQLPEIGDESVDVQLFDPQHLPQLAFPRDTQIIVDWFASRSNKPCHT